MAYRNLYKPLSQFVDPMSTEISATLKERYLQNFQAQDAISQSMSDLTVASFENDQKMYNDMYNNTRSELDGLSERGDYENMFMPVSRLAKKYRETASPLVENYARYQTDKEAKEKMLEEGKITMSDYQGWLKKSKLTEQDGDYAAYKGIEMDENGRVNKSSMYGGTAIAQYVDVQQEILDALNDIPEVKRGGHTVKGYQYEDGLVYAIEEEGQTIERIPEEAVRAVTNNILNRPDVSAYMQQTADFTTLDMDEGTIDSILAKHSYDLKEQEETAGADAVDRIRTTASLGDKRRAARSIAYNKDASNYLGTALATRQPSAYGGSYKMTYDKALNEKLEENRLGAGAFRVVTPGGQFELRAANIIDKETQKVSAASINSNVQRLGEATDLAIQTAVDVIPELQQVLTANSRQPLEERLQDVPTLVDDIMRINPQADRATVVNQLNAVNSQVQLFQQEAELSQRLLRNSYGDFAETFVADALSDMAIAAAVPADDFKSYFDNVDLKHNFVYDAETNTITATKDEPKEGAREAANIAILSSLLHPTRKDGSKISNHALNNSIFKNTGTDQLEAMSELVQGLFEVDKAEADEMLQIAQSVKVDYSPITTTTRSATDPFNPGLGRTERSIDSEVPQISSMLYSAVDKIIADANNESVEFLEGRDTVNYSMDVTSVALGDDKKGTMSKLIRDELKGRDLSAYSNSNIMVPAGTEKGISTVGGLLGENIGLAQIADVDFTQVLTPTGIQAGIVLQLKKATGADRDATLGTSSVTMLYDDVISSFDPTMQDRITNTFDSPAARMVNNSLSLMMSIPGAVSAEEGITLTDNINGTNLEITMFPTVRPMGDENVDIIAGINRVTVKSSGGDGEPLETSYMLDAFIERYNELKAQTNQ